MQYYMCTMRCIRHEGGSDTVTSYVKGDSTVDQRQQEDLAMEGFFSCY